MDPRAEFDDAMAALENPARHFTAADGIRLVIATGALRNADPPLTPAERAAVRARIDAARAQNQPQLNTPGQAPGSEPGRAPGRIPPATGPTH